jgi:hypothetical protein
MLGLQQGVLLGWRVVEFTASDQERKLLDFEKWGSPGALRY